MAISLAELDRRVPAWRSLAVALAIIVVFFGGNRFVDYAAVKMTVLVAMAVLVAVCLLNFTFHQQRIRGRLLGFALLVMSSTALVEGFAEIYATHGIVAPDGTVTHDEADCLYLSIVTWTTLGYGDFRPTENIRIVAATESLVGYLYFGLIVAILFEFVRHLAPRKRHDAEKNEEVAH